MNSLLEVRFRQMDFHNFAQIYLFLLALDFLYLKWEDDERGGARV